MRFQLMSAYQKQALLSSLRATALSNEAIDGAVVCSFVPAKTLLPPIQLNKM